jgi:hypothetical protein
MYIINIYNMVSLVNPLIFLIRKPMFNAFISPTPVPSDEESKESPLGEAH